MTFAALNDERLLGVSLPTYMVAAVAPRGAVLGVW